jgi:hypothetical protein
MVASGEHPQWESQPGEMESIIPTKGRTGQGRGWAITPELDRTLERARGRLRSAAAAAAPSTERKQPVATNENMAVARRFLEDLVSTGNPALAGELLAPDFVLRFGGNPPMDGDGFKQLLGMFRSAFPDLRVTVEDEIAEGEKVATRFTWRGTHRGAFQGIAPTGRGCLRRAYQERGACMLQANALIPLVSGHDAKGARRQAA